MENDEHCITRRRSLSSDTKKIRNLLQSSIELDNTPLKEEKLSLWSKLKNKMSNFKNNIKYNTFSLNKLIDYYSYEVIRLYDKYYSTKNDFNLFNIELYYVIYFSYRSNFPAIYNSKNKNKYISDCGWGCMIRTAQMILARGIQLLKIQEEPNQVNEKTIETISLFLELYLDNEIWKRTHITMVNKINHISGNSFEVRSALPPFSIQNICKVGEMYGKYAGEWFSDVNMVNIFSNLNEEYEPISNLKIIHFQDGVIYKNTIDSNIPSQKFPKLIIFVSVRHGLSKLSTEYTQSVKDFFSLPFNIGIIGGRDYNAHYFIGLAGENLLYLDPHLNQGLVNSIDDLNKDPSSYMKKQIYELNVKNMSPAFTMGFCIYDRSQYDVFISALKCFSENSEYSVFKFKEESSKDNGIGLTNELLNEFVENDKDDF